MNREEIRTIIEQTNQRIDLLYGELKDLWDIPDDELDSPDRYLSLKVSVIESSEALYQMDKELDSVEKKFNKLKPNLNR